MGKCCYCNREFSNAPGANGTREHLIPISKGGAHHTSNIRIACSRCNAHRAAKDYVNWQYELARMISAKDESIFTIAEMKIVIERAGICRRIVENSVPKMWYNGKIGVIEPIRKIKQYNK